MQHIATNKERTTGLFPGLPRFTALCAVLVLFVFPPGDAKAQTCFAIDDGDWTDTAVWSDADDTTGGDCPATGGIPDQAGESAVITDGVILSLDADIGPIDELTIGTSFALLDPRGNFTLDVDGPLTVNSTGTIDLVRAGRVLTMDIQGLLTVDGGSIEGGASASVTAGGLFTTNSGNVQMQGGTVTINGDVSNTAIFRLGSGGSMTVFGNVTNTSTGTFDQGTSQLTIDGGDLQNDGAYRASENFGQEATLIFQNTDLLGNSLSGDFLQSNSNAIFNLQVNGSPATAQVNLDTDIDVRGSLFVGVDGQLGQPGEDNIVTYSGTDFEIEFVDDANKGFFYASRVSFNRGASTASDPVSAAGEIFAETQITNNAYVELTQPLIINENLRIESDGLAITSSGALTLRDDFNVGSGATFLPGTSTVTFDGQTNAGTTDPSALNCDNNGGLETSDGDCEQDVTAGGAITFGPVEVDGTDTRVVISGFSSNNVIPSVGNLTIDPGQDDTNTQLALNDSDLEITGNVINDGTLNVGSKELRFVSGSSQLISSPLQDLSFADMFVSNTSTSSITLDAGTNLAISDTLEVDQGKVTIGSGSTLSVDGALALYGSEEVGGAFRNGVAVDATATDAELVLTSTETTEGYVLYRDFDGGGTIDGRVDGNVIKERFMNIGQAWYFVGVPEEATTNDTFSEFFEQDGESDLHLQGFPGADQDQDNSDDAANVYQYNEAIGGDEDFGFEVIPSASTTMETGRGYILFAFRDDDFNTGGQQGGFPKLLDTRVEMPSGVSFSFPVTASDPDTDGFDSTDGWNLLSNPTLAALNWESIYNQASTAEMTPTLYIWDDVNNAYQTWNAATQTGSRSDTLAIDPHQGFFLKASGTSPALSIDDVEDVQLNGAGSFAGKSFSPTTPTTVAFRVDWNGRKNEAFVTLLEGGEFNEDALDSYQLEPFRSDGGAVSLFSSSNDGVALETNVIPGEISEEVSVPLHVQAFGCNSSTPIEGEAVMTWPEFRNLPSGVGLMLEDNQTGDIYDLRVDNEVRFNLTSETACGSKSTAEGERPAFRLKTMRTGTSKSMGGGRFLLTIIPNNALPVEMGSFTGSADGERSAVLEWTTLSESNNAGFYVEQKVDGSFQTVSSLIESAAANGTTTEQQSYRFRLDDLEVGTTHTFRLRQVDVDGDKSYSDPVEVKLGIQDAYQLEAYPNPVQGGQQAKVRFAVDERQPVTVELYNTLGQRVRTIYNGAPRVVGEFQEVMVNADDLASGVYFVRMRGDSFATTQKLVVVR